MPIFASSTATRPVSALISHSHTPVAQKKGPIGHKKRARKSCACAPRNWLVTSEIRVAKIRFRGTTSATKTEGFSAEGQKALSLLRASLSTVFKFSSPQTSGRRPCRWTSQKKAHHQPIGMGREINTAKRSRTAQARDSAFRICAKRTGFCFSFHWLRPAGVRGLCSPWRSLLFIRSVVPAPLPVRGAMASRQARLAAWP